MNFVRPWLAIGKYVETTDEAFLIPNGITAMLQLSDPAPQPGIETLHLNVRDGRTMPLDIIGRGIDFICEQKAQGKVILVACGAGISRSVIFAWGALMQEEKLDFFEAFRQIREAHPQAQPYPGMCLSLSNHFGLNLSMSEIANGMW
jgi:hypothetical protein